MWLALAFAGMFFALQFAPSPVQPLVRSTTDPRVHLQIVGHPEVEAILDRACKDCHSNQTHVPWYGYVAPMSWMVSQHVNQGREMLNFSDWDSRQPTANEMEELCDAVSSGSMPLRSYTLIHRKAILSKRDVDAICKLADTQPSSTAQLSGSPAALTRSKEKRN
jgi:heme-binding protein